MLLCKEKKTSLENGPIQNGVTSGKLRSNENLLMNNINFTKTISQMFSLLSSFVFLNKKIKMLVSF